MSEYLPAGTESGGGSAAAREADRHLEGVIESLLMASGEPLSGGRMAALIREVEADVQLTEGDVGEAVERLNRRYEAADAAFRIERWAGAYRLSTLEAYGAYVAALHREPPRRLSRSLLETLAIVAYRQPATKAEVDFVRGVDSGYALNKLLESALIDLVGRSSTLGRPLLYGTTERFLDAFGLDSLGALPQLKEIEAILGDASFDRDRAAELLLNPIHSPSPDENDQEGA